MKVQLRKFEKWMKDLKILFRNPKFVGLVTVAIITVSLPITIITLNTNTDNRQHASGCNYQTSYLCLHKASGDTSTPNNDWRSFQQNNVYGNCATNEFCNYHICVPGTSHPPCQKITSCTCKSGQEGKKGGSFSCSGGGYDGQVNRACGSDMWCDSSAKQGGVWPCSHTQPKPTPVPTIPPSACGCESGTKTCVNGSEKCTGGGKLRCGAGSTTACHNTCSSNTCSYALGSGSNACSTTGSSCTSGSNPYCGDGVCNNGETSSSCPSDCGSGTSGGGKTIKNQYNECVIAGLHIDGECRSTWETPDGRTISNGSYTGWQAHIIQYSDGTYNDCSSMDFTFTGCGGVGGVPTDTPTPEISPTDTPAPSPTDSPIPPDPSKTTGNIALQFEGISPTENPTPLHPNRQIILYFYPPTDTSFQQIPYVSPIGIVTYNSATGFFSNANFPLKGLLAGQYLVLVRSLDGSLVSQIGTGDGTGPITITTTGDTNMLVDTQDTSDTNADTTVPILKMGDIVISGNSFNIVDTLDYSTFVDCYGNDPSHLSDACFKHQGIIDVKTQVFLPDLNDDGKIDGIDYTLLERNYGHYGVGANTMNRGTDPTKN